MKDCLNIQFLFLTSISIVIFLPIIVITIIFIALKNDNMIKISWNTILLPLLCFFVYHFVFLTLIFFLQCCRSSKKKNEGFVLHHEDEKGTDINQHLNVDYNNDNINNDNELFTKTLPNTNNNNKCKYNTIFFY